MLYLSEYLGSDSLPSVQVYYNQSSTTDDTSAGFL